jgi:hypothetical protein
MTPKAEVLDELLKDCESPQDVESLYLELLQRMINRSLEAEMTENENHQLLDILCAPPFARVPFLRDETLDDDTIIVVAKYNNIFAIYDDIKKEFGVIIDSD